jgi:hypothetical protein
MSSKTFSKVYIIEDDENREESRKIECLWRECSDRIHENLVHVYNRDRKNIGCIIRSLFTVQDYVSTPGTSLTYWYDRYKDDRLSLTILKSCIEAEEEGLDRFSLTRILSSEIACYTKTLV